MEINYLSSQPKIKPMFPKNQTNQIPNNQLSSNQNYIGPLASGGRNVQVVSNRDNSMLSPLNPNIHPSTNLSIMQNHVQQVQNPNLRKVTYS